MDCRTADTDTKMDLEWNPQVTRRREPRMTWMRSTHAYYQDRYSWLEVVRMAPDRPRCAEFVFALCSDYERYFSLFHCNYTLLLEGILVLSIRVGLIEILI